MNKKTTLIVVISLIVGSVIGFGIARASTDKGNTISDLSSAAIHYPPKEDTMRSMTSGLQGRTGDNFDKAFIAGMIEHHQGAIDMAKMALQNAQHQEIKDMATDIISAQSQEIDQMKQWEKSWYNQ